MAQQANLTQEPLCVKLVCAISSYQKFNPVFLNVKHLVTTWFANFGQKACGLCQASCNIQTRLRKSIFASYISILRKMAWRSLLKKISDCLKRMNYRFR